MFGIREGRDITEDIVKVTFGRVDECQEGKESNETRKKEKRKKATSYWDWYWRRRRRRRRDTNQLLRL